MILNIDTSTTVCSASLSRLDGQVVELRESKEANSHAAQLPLFIEDLLQYLNDEPLQAVALSEGPGSYTGLRIGTATAKGLCYGYNIPLLAIPTLKIMAEMVVHQLSTINYQLLCPMIDARRMEVYTAVYQADTLQEILPTEAKIIDDNSFAELLQGSEVSNFTTQGEATSRRFNQVYFFGNGADKCKSVLTHPNAHFIDGIYPSAAYMGRLAAEAYTQKTFQDIAYFDPFYLKEFQAGVKKSLI